MPQDTSSMDILLRNRVSLYGNPDMWQCLQDPRVNFERVHEDLGPAHAIAWQRLMGARKAYLDILDPGEASGPDEFGDRMKLYESFISSDRLIPGLPVVARIDGRGFSKFTRAFEKPFDAALHNAMSDACKALVEHFQPAIGYTQSDEISLVWDDFDKFDRKISKIVSILAGFATAHFMKSLMNTKYSDVTLEKCPHFDARVKNVPDRVEATNALLWRYQDAKRNGVSSAARCHMSPREMHGKSTEDLIRTMGERSVDYERYPAAHRFGSWFQRRAREEVMELEKWESIPPLNRPESRSFERSRVERVPFEDFDAFQNRVQLVFGETEMIERREEEIC